MAVGCLVGGVGWQFPAHIKMEMINDQMMSLEGRGTTTPSGVRAEVGMPSAARIGLAGVFMLALLYPYMSVDSSATMAEPHSGRLGPPLSTTGDSCSGISVKLSDRLASDTTELFCTTREVRPGTATYARSASDEVREKPPTSDECVEPRSAWLCVLRMSSYRR